MSWHDPPTLRTPAEFDDAGERRVNHLCPSGSQHHAPLMILEPLYRSRAAWGLGGKASKAATIKLRRSGSHSDEEPH